MNRKNIIIILLISSCLNLKGQEKIIRLSIDLNSSENVEVVPATLKYNKDFAFSFTFDDGMTDAFEIAYRLFNGGYSVLTEETYPGLYYTDGCGNQLPFTASIAWFTVNLNGEDVHNSAGSDYLTWSQATQLYNAGWSFLNHSYNHTANEAGIDYTWQLNQNNLAFYERTGHYLNYVIPPSGDEKYIIPAFELGALAIFTSNGANVQTSGKPMRVDEPIMNEHPVFWRHSITSDQYNAEELKNSAAQVFQNARPDNHLWWNEFTHEVKTRAESGGVRFADFKEYMEYLESNFGINGNDNMLFANSIEVFEYIKVRDNIGVQVNQIDDRLEIELDYSACPLILRYYDISLLLSGAEIQTIEASDVGQVSYSNKTDYSLVNIKLPESYFTSTTNMEFSYSNEWLIYPNPAKDHIMIKSKEPASEDIEIFLIDFLGRKISSQMLLSGASSIRVNFDSRKTKKGYYLLLAYQNDQIVMSEKILID